jgi:hypothetical protein
MSTTGEPTEFIEERVPPVGLPAAVHELVELYGGSITSTSGESFEFELPLRRGVAASGGIACRLSWAVSEEGATVRLVCDRDVDAPKIQRILLLAAGVVGAFFWLLWPFFPNLGALAWVGGAIAIAAYFLSLRRTSGGLASDFLQRLARHQRSVKDEE